LKTHISAAKVDKGLVPVIPVAFTSALSLITSLSFLRSNGQKQSINDASQYVAVLTHLPEGVGMNVAKLQKSYRIKMVFTQKNLK